MTITDAKKKVYIQNCSEMMQAKQDSGLSLKEWCRQNGISESTYSYRIRRLREYALDLMQGPPKPPAAIPGNIEKPVINIAKIERAASKTSYDICIKTNVAEIGINNTACPEHVKMILEGLLHA